MTQSYKELIVWQKAMILAQEIYRLTEALPRSEVFGLTSQMRRSAVSIPSNIAEGYMRNTRKEYAQFLKIASGSAAELETQLLLANHAYPPVQIGSACGILLEVQKMLSVLHKKINLSSKLHHLNSKDGFTLIELMVAMSLFVIVVGIASGTFVRSLRTQRQVVSLMAANDNASFALERMVREIRTGTAFSSAGDRLSFTNDEGEAVSYDIAEGAVRRNGQPLTASTVLATHLAFSLSGAEVGDGQSTRVTIFLGVSARGRMESFVTRLQTTVSARVLDG